MAPGLIWPKLKSSCNDEANVWYLLQVSRVSKEVVENKLQIFSKVKLCKNRHGKNTMRSCEMT